MLAIHFGNLASSPQHVQHHSIVVFLGMTPGCSFQFIAFHELNYCLCGRPEAHDLVPLLVPGICPDFAVFVLSTVKDLASSVIID